MLILVQKYVFLKRNRKSETDLAYLLCDHNKPAILLRIIAGG